MPSPQPPRLPEPPPASGAPAHALLAAILAAPTGLLLIATDPAFRIHTCNPLAAELFGKAVEAVIGRTVPEIHDELGVDNARFFAAVARARAEGEYTFRQRIAAPDGIRHLESRLIPLPGSDGNPLGYLLLARDRTDLARADETGRTLLRAVEQSPVSILITDPQGTVEYVNTRFTQITGYTRDEALGQRAGLLHSGLTPHATYADLWQTLLAGREWSGELQNRRKNGELYWDRLHIMPVSDESGAITHFVSLQEDISARKADEARLRESEALHRTIFDNALVGLCFVRERRFVSCNPRFEAILGYGPGELIGQPARAIYLDDADYAATESVYAAAASGSQTENEARFRRKDGSVIWCLRSGRVIDPAAPHAGSIWIFADITERRRQEEALRLWATVFENSSEAVMITDRDNRIVTVNAAFTEITGYPAAEVAGRNPSLLGSGRHDADFFAAMWATLRRDGRWQGEIWDRRKSGEIYPKWLGISAVRGPDGELTHYVAIFSDISESKAAQARIEYLAHHDALTGLPNRTLLHDRLRQALARAERDRLRVALLFIDLDRFKTINDSLGHALGDHLLQEMAERLQGSLRESDTLSRLGGDEFVVVLGAIHGTEDAAAITQKLLERAREPFHIDGHRLLTSLSIGIALYPDDGSNGDALLRNADTAMYHAKDSGRNAYRFFNERMNVIAHERLAIHNRFKEGLERGEFTLHYQPQVELVSGRIVGVEALARWHSADLGNVPPARFIPVAEENGMIIALGTWVLREACRQARQWQEEGLPPLTVAVNISPLQLRQTDFVATVLDALAAYGLPAATLELEVTESVLIEDVDQVLAILGELRARGIGLAIDDFGTGYSSLAYLKRFAVNRLKIDRSFIDDIPGDADDAAIVRAVVQMAASLRLRTLAEGVEHPEQLAFLREAGCDEVQGYLCARPQAADAIVRLWQDGQGRLAAPAPPAA